MLPDVARARDESAGPLTAAAGGWPTISVVVPSYNQGHYLEAALASLFDQEYPGLEVVAMDGGSTDDSPQILARWAGRLRHWQSAPDGGQSAAINDGMRRTTGKLVTWLNSDDCHCGDALWTVGAAYRAHPGHGLYIGNGLRHLQATGEIMPFSRRHMTLVRRDLEQWTFTLQQPSLYFARHAWEDVGGLDESLCYVMDWDVAIRVAARNSAVLIHEFLSVAREHSDAKTQRGGFDRVAEIVSLGRARTGQPLTLGGLNYAVETVLELAEGRVDAELVSHLRQLRTLTLQAFASRHGRGYWTSAHNDAQDSDYLPLSTAGPSRPYDSMTAWPSIGVVVLAGEQAERTRQTVANLEAQAYPRLAITEVVADGAASAPHREHAAALRGLAQGKTEVACVLRAGERLATDALFVAGREFARDARLTALYGNALWVHGECIAPVDAGVMGSAMWLSGHPAVDGGRGTRAPILSAPRAGVFFHPDRLGLREPLAPAAWVARLGAIERARSLERVLALLPVPHWPSRRVNLGDHTYAAWGQRAHPLSRALRRLRNCLRVGSHRHER